MVSGFVDDSGYSLTISCEGYGARYIMDDANVPVSQFRIFNFSSKLRPVLYYSPCYPFRILDSCVKTIQPTWPLVSFYFHLRIRTSLQGRDSMALGRRSHVRPFCSLIDDWMLYLSGPHVDPWHPWCVILVVKMMIIQRVLLGQCPRYLRYLARMMMMKYLDHYT